MNNYQPKNAGFIDTNLVYPIANIFSSIIYKLGLSPNQITIITLIIRCIAIYNLYYKRNYNLIFILFAISWVTDALDGIIARKYDMASELGAKLDVFVDIFTCFTTLCILYLQYYINNPKLYYIGISIFVAHYFLMIIKLRNNKSNYKPWEKVMSCYQ